MKVHCCFQQGDRRALLRADARTDQVVPAGTGGNEKVIEIVTRCSTFAEALMFLNGRFTGWRTEPCRPPR